MDTTKMLTRMRRHIVRAQDTSLDDSTRREATEDALMYAEALDEALTDGHGHGLPDQWAQ